MSKLYSASIDVTQIDKDRLFKGKKGTYLNVMIWVNDDTDKYGNSLSIQQQVNKGEDRIYLGNGKEFDINKTPQPEAKKEDPTDDLPF